MNLSYLKSETPSSAMGGAGGFLNNINDLNGVKSN